MNDSTYLGAFVYIIIIVLFAPFLPSEIYTGQFDADGDLSTAFNVSASDVDGLGEQLGFFQKIALLAFVPFLIEGIPLFIGAILTLFNYVSFTIFAVFIYDKVRGI